MTPNATCAYTGQALTIRNDGTHPFINLDGHGGIYFVDEAAKHAWCQENVRWNPKTQCYEPKGGTVTINGTAVPAAGTS